jgi:hypothetical protein
MPLSCLCPRSARHALGGDATGAASGASASLGVYLVLLASLGLIASATFAWKQRRT